MPKRLTAILTAAASLPMAAVLSAATAAPAAAADCPNQYPPGNAYGLRISPSSAVIEEDFHAKRFEVVVQLVCDGPHVAAAIVLVPAEVAMEELAVDRHRDREDLVRSEALDRLKAWDALAIAGIAPAVADAAHPGLPGGGHRYQTRAEREQQLRSGCHGPPTRPCRF